MEKIINLLLKTNRILSILHIIHKNEKIIKKKINNDIYFQFTEISLKEIYIKKIKGDLILTTIHCFDDLKELDGLFNIMSSLSNYGSLINVNISLSNNQNLKYSFKKNIIEIINKYFFVDGIITDKNKENFIIFSKKKIKKPKPLKSINNIFDIERFKKNSFYSSNNFKANINGILKEVEEVIPHVNKKRHAIDIGARYGIFSSFLIKHNFKKISSFELVPYFRECFLKNTQSNYVDFYNLGLYDSETHIKFSGRAGKQIQSIGNDGIKVYSLDYFEFDEVDLIKIDVDGCERQILRGARKTIIKHKPTIHVETEKIQLKYDPEGLNKLEDIYEWLINEFNYKVVSKNRNTILTPRK